MASKKLVKLFFSGVRVVMEIRNFGSVECTSIRFALEYNINRYLDSREDLIKLAAALHLLPAKPDAIMIDDIGSFRACGPLSPHPPLSRFSKQYAPLHQLSHALTLLKASDTELWRGGSWAVG
jgi:hypothetical protein